MNDDIVKRIRRNIAIAGGSELKAIATNEGLKGLRDDKQLLLIEMNKAKKTAAEEAAAPYLELIHDLDEQYAFLLQMIGENREDPL